ncbi:MAG: class I adenylate-forming enzyme family protein [Spirochaetia bacterium]
MIGIEKEISATLRGWGEAPAFLQVSRAGGASSTTALEFSRQILDTANQLHAWGIREKHLVPIFLGNSTDFIIIFLSLLRIGAIPVLAKLEYRTLELDEIFENAQPSAIIAEKEHLGLLKPHLRNRIVIARSGNRFSLIQSSEDVAAREDIPDDIASINYTYRGYGYPLGAMISHAQYLHGARVLQDGLQAAAGEKMLVILPMAHIFTMVGCILVPLLYRMTSVIVDTLNPRLLFQYVRDFRIEHITSVPEIYELLFRLRDPAIDHSSLKVFVSGGSILTPDSFANLTREFSIDLLHGYGLTEFTPVSRNMRNEARPGTVGPLCDQVECRIDASTPEEAGEILIKTPHETGVYYRRPRESGEAHRDGWFRTGDMGRIDKGHLVFVRELKKTRKVNGNLVDLEEISRAIRLDKDVADLQVGWEKNSLFAKLALSKNIDFLDKAKELKSALREILAEYKIPKQFIALA